MNRIFLGLLAILIAGTVVTTAMQMTGGTSVPNGSAAGDVPIWNGSKYVPGAVSGSTFTGLSTANADLRYVSLNMTNYVTNNYNSGVIINSTVTASFFSGNGSLLTNLPLVEAAGVIFYMTELQSPYVSTWSTLPVAPTSSAIFTHSRQVTTGGTMVLIDVHMSDTLNISEIKAGQWSFFSHAWVNTAVGGNDSRIIYKVYCVSPTLSASLLFTTTGNNLSTAPYAESDFSTIQPVLPLTNTNCKLMVEYYAWSNTSLRTISQASGGTDIQTYFSTPILGQPLSSVTYGSISTNAIALNGDRRTAWPSGGGGAQTYVYTLPPDAMDFPPNSVDMWIHTGDLVNGAPVTVLPSNVAITCISLNEVVTSGRTVMLDIPIGATTISFNFTGKGSDASAGDVIMFIASRVISANAGVPSWSVMQTSAIANNTSGYFSKYTDRNTLATYGLMAGNSYQLAIGRATGSGSDTYSLPFLLTGLRIEVQ